MTTSTPTLDEVLLADRLLSEEDLRRIRQISEEQGLPLCSLLLEQGLVQETALFEALRRRLPQISVFDPRATPVDAEALRLVPYEDALRCQILPLQLDLGGGSRRLHVAMVDPLDSQIIDELEFATASLVTPLIARHSDLGHALGSHYRGIVTKVMPRPGPPGRIPEGHRGRRLFHESRPAPDASGAGPFELPAPNQDSSSENKIEALVNLLVRKGLIARDELLEELRILDGEE